MREWLKNIRKGSHKSQKDVAKQAGIAQQYYGFIETGKRGSNLPVRTAKAIASVLNFDWKLFYDDSEFKKTDIGTNQN